MQPHMGAGWRWSLSVGGEDSFTCLVDEDIRALAGPDDLHKTVSVSLSDAKGNPSSYRRCKLALNLENYISFVQF